MKTLILSMLVGVCFAGLVERDTLDALKQLHLTNFMTTLTTDQQLLLIDIVAQADAGTLTDFTNTIGYSRILEIFIALSADDERIFKNYIIQRLTLEAQGPINAHHGVATGHGK
ncbi:uncharacterized protein LOC125656869 [Ostrea edulis]|uniref:uncharacterized protein LOC125656869 n=1 Tax=Ostrea edulis TaxID=37623 RepID=UPI0024AFBBC1|nr:uncharacterized protein LOC125656869 [Ostrea edulis]